MTLSGAAVNASAIVLAGGKSSRMGSPKCLLPFDGEPLIAHLVRRLRRLFAEVIVVAAPDQELPPLAVKIVRDEVAFQGPVGGIYYGLQAASAEVCFVTACDVPFLHLPTVEFLLAALGAADVAVAHWDGRLQPLFAVYRRSVLPFLKQQLAAGELRPTLLYEKVATRILSAAELSGADPQGLSFININLPQDYQSALRRWRSG
jgi:molybdopterin-guanine dinucleotide biosynthesis protein A